MRRASSSAISSPRTSFLTAAGRTKILDFGLAKLTERQPAASGSAMTAISPETTPGVVLRTVGYMSPEQVRGLAVDHRADILAFGAIVYEMLSGRRAFSPLVPRANPVDSVLWRAPVPFWRV